MEEAATEQKDTGEEHKDFENAANIHFGMRAETMYVKLRDCVIEEFSDSFAYRVLLHRPCLC